MGREEVRSGRGGGWKWEGKRLEWEGRRGKVFHILKAARINPNHGYVPFHLPGSACSFEVVCTSASTTGSVLGEGDFSLSLTTSPGTSTGWKVATDTQEEGGGEGWRKWSRGGVGGMGEM